MANRLMKDIIRDFIEFYGRPFTVRTVVNETGVNRNTAMGAIKKYYRAGIIKQIDLNRNTKIYVKVDKHVKNDDTYYDFTPKYAKLMKLYGILCQPLRTYQIIDLTSYSRETVNRYLCVLLMMGAISKKGDRLLYRKYHSIPDISIPQNPQKYHYYRDKYNNMKMEKIRIGKQMIRILKKVIGRNEL